MGQLADRDGYKLVLRLALVLSCCAAAVATIATHVLASYLVFGLFGAFGAFGGGAMFSALDIVTELCTPAQRQPYVGLASTLSAPIAGLSPLLGGLLVCRYGYQAVLAVSLSATANGLAILSLKVKTRRYGKASVA